MVGAWGDWWLGHDGGWRQGSPPPGWRRARNGTWYPADHTPGDTEDTVSIAGGVYGAPTVEMHDEAYPAGGGPYGARHLAGAVPGDASEGDPDHPDPPAAGGWLPPFSSWPPLARLGVLAAAALVALAGLLVVSEMFRRGDDAPAPASAFGRLGPSMSTPLAPGTVDSTTTSTSTSTTATTEAATTAPPTTASLPSTSPAGPPTAPDAGVRYRNCNQARATGAAPLLPGDPGYDPALDSNGNGVACDGADAPRRAGPDDRAP